jgi:hypothetical protein
MEYPWYEIIKNGDLGLQQGDLIPGCPLVVPPPTIQLDIPIQVELHLIDSIVLSQSCDLENEKINFVLVCPYYPLKQFLDGLPESERSEKAKVKVVENLKRGHLPAYHLLSKNEDDLGVGDYQVVDFKDVYGIQLSALKNHVSKTDRRLRLLPPYREHLAQSFARFIMRVGLPQDIKVKADYLPPPK